MKSKAAVSAPADSTPRYTLPQEARAVIGAGVRAAAERKRIAVERLERLISRVDAGEVRVVGRDGKPADF